MIEPVYSFGAWLRQRREALVLTRAELAQCAGCSVSALRKIEADERRPSEQLAALLARCLAIGTEERQAFIEAARHQRPVDRLAAPAVASIAANFQPTPTPPPPSPNLPLPPVPLVGREAELKMLAQLLDNADCRLLSLVGPGGIGKTRLALEAACQAWERFGGAVYLVSLAATSAPEFMVTAIAQAVGLSLSGPMPPPEQLIRYLRERRALLVLDNLEHLLAGAGLLAELLQGAPVLKLLVTARVRLALQGEWVFEVQGLPAPAVTETQDLESYSSVALFLHRARRARMNFELSAENGPHIARICRLVEGMPLALELAASWVSVLSCREIASEIESSIDFLSTTMRDVPERQRSLRAVFDHSWELLNEEEQRVLCQLSLFRGGFRREGAELVAGANLFVLAALVSKSLLRRKANGRYDMHELIRQYALKHLQDNTELCMATKERYAAYFLALAEAAEPQIKGAGQLQWLQRLEQDHDNLRTVMKWALADDSAPTQKEISRALQMAGALRWFWCMRGHYHEGRNWLLQLLARCPQQRTLVCACALEGAAILANALGENGEALRLAKESIAIYREVGNRPGLADGLTIGGAALRWQGNFALANAWQEEALTIRRDVGDRWGAAQNLFELGRNLADFGGDARGRAMLVESATILEELGDRHILAGVFTALGIVAIGHAEYDSALSYFERALATGREVGGPSQEADALANLGYVLRVQGDYATAQQHFEAAVQLFQKGGHPLWDIDPLCALVENDISRGRLVAARARLEQVCARPELKANSWLQVLAGYLQGILAYYERDFGFASAQLDETITLARQSGYRPDLARALVARGRVMRAQGAEQKAVVVLGEGLHLFQELGHKLGIVTALEALAELATGDAEQATRLLATADAARSRSGAPLPPVDRPGREQMLAAIRACLGEETFAQAWAEGQATSPEYAATSILDAAFPRGSILPASLPSA